MKTYHVLATLAVCLGVAIQYIIQSTIFGGFLAVAFMALLGVGYGRLFVSLSSSQARLFGGLLASVIIMVMGAIIYRVFQLDQITASIILILVTLPPLFFKPNNHPTEHFQVTRPVLILLSLTTLLAGALTYILTTHGTTLPIRTPWQVVPPIYWPTLFVFWVVWLSGLLHSRDKLPWYIPAYFISLGIFVMYSVAQIIYQIGYGFDPFIHQATQQLIAEQGVVYPKPWYYLGQYSFVVLLYHLTYISIETLDRWLLPILTIVSLSTTLVYTLQNKLHTSSALYLTSATLLLIPLSFLIATTPQGLANLLFIILVLVAWSSKSPHLSLLSLLAIATTSIHPIAGIPSLLLVSLFFIQQYLSKFKILSSSILTLVAIPVIPLLFWWQNSQHISTDAPYALPPITNAWQWLYTTNRFELIFDTIYLWHWNAWLIFIAIVVAGIFIAYRRQTLSTLTPILFTTLYLLTNWLLLSNIIHFSFLIAYEQALFADRFLTLSALSVLPFFFLGAYSVWQKILSHTSAPHRQVIILTCALLATITVYVTYPRFDAYQYDRGYSTSASDLEAVRQIHTDANEQDYIVLANQAVSAAALRELGFYKYYTRADQPTGEQIFFYPIPTGGSLYQIYLEMVYDAPTREVAEKAMKLTGVDTVYFVLNDYWFNSEEIADIASTQADQSWQVQDDIWVFKFNKQ